MERIKVDKENNEVIISLNEKFYDQKFIDKAIEDFKEACDIRKDKGLIFLKPKEELDINTLGYEFYNYVLGLIKNG